MVWKWNKQVGNKEKAKWGSLSFFGAFGWRIKKKLFLGMATEGVCFPFTYDSMIFDLRKRVYEMIEAPHSQDSSITSGPMICF